MKKTTEMEKNAREQTHTTLKKVQLIKWILERAFDLGANLCHFP